MIGNRRCALAVTARTGASNFSRNVAPLASHFRLIIPDLLGYGRSTKGIDRTDPFGDLATAMLGLLDALGVDGAHALGNSLGGACALRMAGCRRCIA